MKMLLLLIGAVLGVLGVIMIYDARSITIKFFGFGDQNEGSLGLKMTGFIIAMIGSFLVFFNV